ncbi:Fur-regulated basic protein A [Scopulibacillus darangshiensis]|uniref:Fur-regulated basic protein A n=1 Tax=Scopulibacillus darangshiensis TaxID=442528 RepID=A0A4R2P368_9BACL|nr:Fur-regulated basic protein FbpA [Scopulibacillus darangshiensis]TCP29209.1 Fur-regulated basic protein A [Scopulibacillus darangshiensis]
MSKRHPESMEKKKNYFIKKLLDYGVYKAKGRQLYELTIGELEREYRRTKLKKSFHG